MEQNTKNKQKEISTLKDDLLKQEKTYKDRIQGIIDAMPDLNKIVGEYEATLKKLKGELGVAKKDAGDLKIELAELKTGVKNKTLIVDIVVNILKFIWGKIRPVEKEV